MPEEINWIELLGYLGSAVVVVSLTLRNITKLRIVNFTGAAIFIVYGYLIKSNPLIILNVIICIIHAYLLIFSKKEHS